MHAYNMYGETPDKDRGPEAFASVYGIKWVRQRPTQDSGTPRGRRNHCCHKADLVAQALSYIGWKVGDAGDCIYDICSKLR